MPIHPTAIIDKRAELDATVDVGPYAVIESNVSIAANTRIYPHVYIAAGTTIGQRCQIHPFASVGDLPQDTKFDGSETFTRIGDDVVIREHASIHRGTTPGSATIIGNGCFLMTTSHVGHNCILGNNITIISSSLLAGHVTVQDRALIGGNSAVHQFVRIGELAMIAGGVGVRMDVPPFMSTGLNGIAAPNRIGLRRAGFDIAQRNEILDCYRTLYRANFPFREAIARVTQMVQTDPGRRLADFLRAPSKRGIQGPAHRRRTASDESDDV